MGGTASKVGKAFGLVSGDCEDEADSRGHLQKVVAGVKISAHVWTRTSSQFFDTDGHVAHDFYEEVQVSPNKWTMRKISNSLLKPVGRVFLKTPSLHINSTVVLCPVSVDDMLGS